MNYSPLSLFRYGSGYIYLFPLIEVLGCPNTENKKLGLSNSHRHT